MSSTYAWVITVDHLAVEYADEEHDAAGTLGPRNTDLTPEVIRANGDTFRMYDDDGILYYSGSITGDYEGFEPLDDFGTPYAGCTEIRYQQPDGTWTTL